MDVAHKNQAATLWCENATALTGTHWQYIIVHQAAYEQMGPDLFADLSAVAQSLF